APYRCIRKSHSPLLVMGKQIAYRKPPKANSSGKQTQADFRCNSAPSRHCGPVRPHPQPPCPPATEGWDDEGLIRKNPIEELAHSRPNPKSNRLLSLEEPASESAELAGCRLIASDGFGGFFLGLVGTAISVAVGMAVAIAAGWGDRDRLAG